MMNTNLCDQFTVMVSIENLTFIRRLYMQKDRVDFKFMFTNYILYQEHIRTTNLNKSV